MHSRYYNYSFISPVPIFAEVREGLKSYFDAGLVNDMLFPVWLNTALAKIRSSSLKIQTDTLCITDYEARLPVNFSGARELWACEITEYGDRKIPGSYYTQVASALNQDYSPCVDCDPSLPADVFLTYKVNTYERLQVRRQYLLIPGNTETQGCCINYPYSLYKPCPLDKFSIANGKLNTEFQQGDVYMVYYSSDTDENGYQLIPDNERFTQYLKAYLYFNIFEMLWHTVTDESSNQISEKFLYYKGLSEDAYSNLDVELKKDTTEQRVQRMHRYNNRFDIFESR